MNATTRKFDVPAHLAPRGTTRPCFSLRPLQPASCLTKPAGRVFDRTYVGIYPPLPYILPGLAARAGKAPASGLVLARLASGLVSVIVLALCLAGVRDRAGPALSLLEVTVALSPTVSSSLGA